VLIPTAERDPSLGLWILGSLVRGVRAIMYNSFEERAVIQRVSGNEDVPEVVVGVGSNVPANTDPERFRQKFEVQDPFVLYVGRIDANKGCGELFEYFATFAAAARRPTWLLLIGTAGMDIPKHPRIRHLGYVADEDKFDAIAAAQALVMPSYYESLSMAALEAWALGRPVLANARCDVLVGQCRRSNGGLYYQDAREFAAALQRLLDDRRLASALGRNGRAYYEQHYDWPVIERKYLDMFARLDAEGPRRRTEPLPGWWARRRRTLPPAREVIDGVPSGPAADAPVPGPRSPIPDPRSPSPDPRSPIPEDVS
jgi:glycosyltransferase involved in cell wall biosynthesis